jgi:hypothetical protein
MLDTQTQAVFDEIRDSTSDPAAAWPAGTETGAGQQIYRRPMSNHEDFVNDGIVMPSADVDALLAAEDISAPNPESRGITTS